MHYVCLIKPARQLIITLHIFNRLVQRASLASDLGFRALLLLIDYLRHVRPFTMYQSLDFTLFNAFSRNDSYANDFSSIVREKVKWRIAFNSYRKLISILLVSKTDMYRIESDITIFILHAVLYSAKSKFVVLQAIRDLLYRKV